MLPDQEPSFPPADDLPGGSMAPDTSARQDSADEAPPVGTTPPAQLAALAVQGKRGAAWRLLHWIGEDSQEAIEAIRQFPDRHLLELLLEWLALGAWAGKPLKVPRAMRQPHLRTQVRTLFLPGSGAPEDVVKAVLIAGLHHPQEAVRETAAHLLGIVGEPSTAVHLADALHDPASEVRVQAAKALGRLRVPGVAAALVEALRYHDEALASQIHQTLLGLESAAVPALIEATSSPDAWVRWHALRILGELHDARGLRPLVAGLADEDRAVAWMAAHALAVMDAPVVEDVLRLLLRAPDTPQLMETAAYVLRTQTNKQLKPILEPVVESMHAADYRVAMPLAVNRALEQLAAGG